MTLAAAPEPTPSGPPRTPIWLTADERADLTDAIVSFLTDVSVFPRTEQHLRDVLLELEVTSARDRLWPHPATAWRTAAGYSPDTVAVRLSADERTALTTVAYLPESIRVALA